MVFAAISPYPDIAIPFVLAGEAAYLGLLATHPKYQSFVEAQEHKELRDTSHLKNQQVMERIIRAIPVTLHQRFERLRFRCQELKQIAADLKVPQTLNSDLGFESTQLQNLDKLLWVFLRLLFTQHSLDRFLETVSLDSLMKEKQRIRSQLAEMEAGHYGSQSPKIRHTLEDSLKTLDERIVNIEQAHENSRYVGLELDRLENKIISLAELAVNRQDPNYISSQVDAVANSVKETERTMSDLQFITGLGPLDETAPEMIRQPVTVRN